MELSNCVIAEKISYSVVLETNEEKTECTVELLTGDYDYDSLTTLLSSLDDINFVGVHLKAANYIWSHIKSHWSDPPDIVAAKDEHRLEVTITRIYSDNGDFDYDGCDIPDCDSPGLGNNVYECIAYESASHIKHGHYIDVSVCGECLCKYHNGE